MKHQNILSKISRHLFSSLVCILLTVMAAAVPVTGLEAAQSRVEIIEPVKDKVWIGVKRIKIEVYDLDMSDIRTMSVYLDGRLIKEFTTPPYSFNYNFGQSPRYRKLEVLATTRNVTGKKHYRHSIKSFYADDFQTVDVMQVVVPVVVTDRRGNYVPGLRKDDFQILEDGVKQNVSYFNTSGKSTFHLALLIDISSSMKDKISEVKQVARSFLKQLLRQDDKAIVLFFNHDVFEDSEFTNDVDELANSLSVAIPFGATALYDAIAYSVKLLKSIIGQNIIILFSDGEDNSSTIDPYTLMKIVERSNSVIYSIGRSMDVQTQYQELLSKISTSSGGMTFFFDDVSQLKRLYSTIRRDIQAKYVLQFAPRNSKKQNRFRKITVKLSDKGRKKYGRGLNIRTMKGYFY